MLAAAIVVAGMAALLYLFRANSEFFSQFQPFSVTVINESDYDIVSVETGILKSAPTGQGVVESGSRHVSNKTIKSGKTAKIKPDLSLRGEGGIYLKYTNANGETVQKGVCSYTEYVSGYSKVTIRNDGASVEEKCN